MCVCVCVCVCVCDLRYLLYIRRFSRNHKLFKHSVQSILILFSCITLTHYR